MALTCRAALGSGGRAARTPLGPDGAGRVGGAGRRRVNVSGGLGPDRWPRQPRPSPFPTQLEIPGPTKWLQDR